MSTVARKTGECCGRELAIRGDNDITRLRCQECGSWVRVQAND